ncbi:MAG: DMT family transporter [Candidatus Woesearchaeota archaeon]|nr:DMT family transporter [Candidatus Woesearchaeota archaeon]
MKAAGIALVLSSLLCYSILAVLLKKANQDIKPFTVIAISMIVLFLISFFMSVFTEDSLNFDFLKNKTAVILLVIVGIINAVGFWLAIKAYPYMPLWQQSLFGMIQPLLTAVFAYFILGEALSWKMFFGFILMAAGLAVAIL